MRKEERTVADVAGSGRTVPVMSMVMFGWVRLNGAAETEATGIGRSSDELDAGGSEIMKSNEGVVRLIVSGAGSTIVACA